MDWAKYLASDPRNFTARLEVAAGLPHVDQLPVSTPKVIAYPLLAAIARLQTDSGETSDRSQAGCLDWTGDISPERVLPLRGGPSPFVPAAPRWPRYGSFYEARMNGRESDKPWT